MISVYEQKWETFINQQSKSNIPQSKSILAPTTPIAQCVFHTIITIITLKISTYVLTTNNATLPAEPSATPFLYATFAVPLLSSEKSDPSNSSNSSDLQHTPLVDATFAGANRCLSHHYPDKAGR